MTKHEDERKQKVYPSKKNARNRKARSNSAENKKISARNNPDLSTSGRDNDPNWYFTDASIAALASSISFGEYLGVKTKLGNYCLKANGDSAFVIKSMGVPSIMSIGVSPCPGNTDDTQQGINLAALKMYSELSSMNAKATSYAPQDLTILMLSLGEIISVIEHMRRAFGVAFTYNMRNRDMPKLLLKAMGFDPDDFLTNLAANRLRFNTIITAVNKIPFLNNIAYFYKCADLYQKVYTDDTSAMAQLILLTPHTTWTLDEKYNSNGSGLVTTALPTPLKPGKFAAWMTIISSMVDKLFQSATFNYIYSDVLNYSAKKGAQLLFLDYLLEGYSIVPEFNENFLLQIHNSTIVGEVYKPESINATGNDVTCDANKNKIKYNACFKATAGSSLDRVVFDFPTDTPTTEDIIEASRFTSLGSTVFEDTDAAKTKYYYGSSFPDHYFNSIYIADIFSESEFAQITSSLIDYSDSYAKSFIYDATYLTKFSKAPYLYLLPSGTAETEDNIMAVLGDVEYYTTINGYYLRKVNDIAVLSLFTLR